MATRIQSLWRGYTTRKLVAKKKIAEVAIIEDHWRHYDEKYRLYVLCQNLMVAVKRDDPLWHADETPFYLWMLEVGGPWIEEAEDFMLRRGWVRPQKSRISMALMKSFFTDALQQCGLTAEEMRIATSLMDTFAAAVEEE
jgi:hypothetical protein